MCAGFFQHKQHFCRFLSNKVFEAFFFLSLTSKIQIRLLKFIRCSSCSRDLSCIIETILTSVKNLNNSKFSHGTQNLKCVVAINIFARCLSDNLKGIYQLTRYHRLLIGLEDQANKIQRFIARINQTWGKSRGC